jgi:hypothetical protein
MALVSCASFRGEPSREPVFLPDATRQALRAGLAESNLWHGAELSAPARMNVLIVELELLRGVSRESFPAVCSAATAIVSQHVSADVPREVRLVRDWRVVYDCAFRAGR